MTSEHLSADAVGAHISAAFEHVDSERVLANAELCRSVLNDVLGGDSARVTLLMQALEFGIVRSIRQAQADAEPIVVPLLAGDLSDARALRLESAEWAVAVWASVLAPGAAVVSEVPEHLTIKRTSPPWLGATDPVTLVNDPPRTGAAVVWWRRRAVGVGAVIALVVALVALLTTVVVGSNSHTKLASSDTSASPRMSMSASPSGSASSSAAPPSQGLKAAPAASTSAPVSTPPVAAPPPVVTSSTAHAKATTSHPAPKPVAPAPAAAPTLVAQSFSLTFTPIFDSASGTFDDVAEAPEVTGGTENQVYESFPQDSRVEPWDSGPAAKITFHPLVNGAYSFVVQYYVVNTAYPNNPSNWASLTVHVACNSKLPCGSRP